MIGPGILAFGRVAVFLRRMEIWVGITIAAAFLQNLRSALQKYLKGRMGTTSATFVRFGFGAPFAILFVLLLRVSGSPYPQASLAFALWVVIGGFAQIGATFLLIHLFSFRNFVVGTAYSRTEPAQAAVFGAMFLGEAPQTVAAFAIGLAVAGVMLISVARSAAGWKPLITAIFSRSAGIGILSGTLFGIAAVAYRAASLSLGGPNFLMQAAYTLATTIILQTVVMLVWLAWRERDELARIAAAWKPSLATGLVGAAASFGWFSAMTLQQAAIVKAVAQVEMLFTFAAAVFWFREHINRLEIAGCVLITGGILALLLAA